MNTQPEPRVLEIGDRLYCYRWNWERRLEYEGMIDRVTETLAFIGPASFRRSLDPIEGTTVRVNIERGNKNKPYWVESEWIQEKLALQNAEDYYRDLIIEVEDVWGDLREKKIPLEEVEGVLSFLGELHRKYIPDNPPEDPV